jgi:hypothetical protein
MRGLARFKVLFNSLAVTKASWKEENVSEIRAVAIDSNKPDTNCP